MLFAQAAANQGGSSLMSLGMIGLFFVVFYFLFIRPQSKRQKEHKKMIEAIQKGDEVSTVGGFLGKVSKVTEQFVVVSVADNVEMNLQKHAISAVLPKGTLKSIKE